MTIMLTYTEEDGTQEQVEYEEYVANIALHSNRIASIDLTPLATCTSLKSLNLFNNQLKSIDLTPLATCTSLQILNLSSNQLKSIDLTPQLKAIDLTPLATCTSLRVLNLEGNQLKSLDLTPLATCTSLKALNLSWNRLQSIDLTPLATCTSLLTLSLNSNYLQSIDLTPLATCTRLQKLNLDKNEFQSSDALYSWLNLYEYKFQFNDALYSWLKHLKVIYKVPINTYPWSFLYRITEQFGKDCRVQQDILCAMGFRNYGFIDCDLSDFFLSIPADTPIDMAREQVREKLLEEVVQAIDQGRTTTGLNVEEMSAQHVEIAERSQRISDLRKAEMKRVTVEVSRQYMGTKWVNLWELWFTAYGYEVLTALEMDFGRLGFKSFGFKEVKKAFKELGFKLKTGKRSGVEMSEELKQAIWWITKHKGLSWERIMGGGRWVRHFQ